MRSWRSLSWWAPIDDEILEKSVLVSTDRWWDPGEVCFGQHRSDSHHPWQTDVCQLLVCTASLPLFSPLSWRVSPALVALVLNRNRLGAIITLALMLETGQRDFSLLRPATSQYVARTWIEPGAWTEKGGGGVRGRGFGCKTFMHAFPLPLVPGEFPVLRTLLSFFLSENCKRFCSNLEGTWKSETDSFWSAVSLSLSPSPIPRQTGGGFVRTHRHSATAASVAVTPQHFFKACYYLIQRQKKKEEDIGNRIMKWGHSNFCWIRPVIQCDLLLKPTSYSVWPFAQTDPLFNVTFSLVACFIASHQPWYNPQWLTVLKTPIN